MREEYFRARCLSTRFLSTVKGVDDLDPTAGTASDTNSKVDDDKIVDTATIADVNSKGDEPVDKVVPHLEDAANQDAIARRVDALEAQLRQHGAAMEQVHNDLDATVAYVREAVLKLDALQAAQASGLVGTMTMKIDSGALATITEAVGTVAARLDKLELKLRHTI